MFPRRRSKTPGFINSWRWSMPCAMAVHGNASWQAANSRRDWRRLPMQNPSLELLEMAAEKLRPEAKLKTKE
jgi:hypothetical protein